MADFTLKAATSTDDTLSEIDKILGGAGDGDQASGAAQDGAADKGASGDAAAGDDASEPAP